MLISEYLVEVDLFNFTLFKILCRVLAQLMDIECDIIDVRQDRYHVLRGTYAVQSRMCPD